MKRRRIRRTVQALTAMCVLLGLMCAWLAWQETKARRIAACYREVMVTAEAPPEGDCDRL